MLLTNGANKSLYKPPGDVQERLQEKITKICIPPVVENDRKHTGEDSPLKKKKNLSLLIGQLWTESEGGDGEEVGREGFV